MTDHRSPLTICLCVADWPSLSSMNGAGRYAQTLARCMAKRGIEVHILTPVREPIVPLKDRLTKGSPSRLGEQRFAASFGGRTSGEPPFRNGVMSDFQEDGYWVHPRVVRPWRVVSRFQPGLGESWDLWRALEALRKTTPLDIVEFSNWEGIGAVSALFSSLPVVIRVHTTAFESLSLGIGHPSLERGYARLEKLAARHARGLMTNSSSHRDQAALNYRLRPEQITVAALGIQDEAITRPVARNPRLVLAVGAASPRKGVDFFLDVAARVLREGVAAEFVWVGKDGRSAPGGRLWSEYAKQAYPQLKECVRFESGVSDARLAEWYARAAVYFCSARYESFGLTLVEAMQAGTPLLSPNTGSVAEITGNEVAGLLYEPQDVESAAGQLKRLLTEPELARRFGEQGRERAKAEYSDEVMTDRVVAVYEKVIGGEGVRGKGKERRG